MTTDTDIANRALQLVGTRTTITSLASTDTNEAVQCNLAYIPIRDWCFGLANWNFLRKVELLTRVKTVTFPAPWAEATSPAPPWQYEYSLPGDFVRAQYLTNGDANGTTNYIGEPKRFAIAFDTVMGTDQEVLLTNETVAILVYTGKQTDPTKWPWLFERLMVTTLAWVVSYQLTGDKELREELDKIRTEAFIVAEQANREEGLSFNDTTPEWIQALGITYPYRRPDPRMRMVEKPRGDDKR